MLVLAGGCGSVEPIGPPESSGDTWTTSSGPSDLSSTGGAQTDGDETSGGDSSGSSSGGSSGTSTGRADGSGSTTGGCPAGDLGCGCLPDNGCAKGLTCATEICVSDLPCPVEEAGMETCQCTDGGGCDEGLLCASELCVDADG